MSEDFMDELVSEAIDEVEELRNILANLKKYSKHLMEKNIEYEVKLSVLKLAMEDAIREADCGEVSDFNLRHAIHKVEDFEDGRAVIQDIWIRLAGLTKGLMYYANPQNWMQEILGTSKDPNGPNVIFGFNEDVGGQLARDTLEKYGVSYDEMVDEPLEEVDSTKCY